MNQLERIEDDDREPIEPDEVLDPLALTIELTSEIGAAARFAFRRSVDDNTHELRTQAIRHYAKLEEWPAFTRELFANLYDPDEVTPLPPSRQSPVGVAAMRALYRQPTFPSLRESASAHRTIAAKSSAKLAALVAAAMGLDDEDDDDEASEDPRKFEDAAEAIEEMMREAGASDEQVEEAMEGLQEAQAEANSRRQRLLANLEASASSAGMANQMQAIANEAKQAADRVQLLRGCGLGRGRSEEGDEGVDEDLLRMLENNPTLVDVLKQCGRIRENAAAEGVVKTNTGACDVIGVVPGDDVNRLLAEELALLDDPDLADHTLCRLLDGETLCWEMEGEDRRDRGDIILLVDKSASMSGAAIVFARALAAACLVSAVGQGRRVVLCMFGSSTTTARVDGQGAGLKDAIKALGLPASDGDTNVQAAMEDIHRRGWEELRDPDLLLITDGIFPYTPQLQKELDRFPDGTRFNGLVVDSGWGSGNLDAHSEWISNIWRMTPGDDKQAVGIFNTVGHKSDDDRGKP